MSIPIKKDIKLIVLNEETVKQFDDNLLDESLHTFKNQYELASFLSGLVVESIKYNKEYLTVNVEKYNLR